MADVYLLISTKIFAILLLLLWLLLIYEARCSSVVRAFAHCAMGRRIDPSWGGSIELFLFQPVLHDWCNKGCGMYYHAYKRTLAANQKE